MNRPWWPLRFAVHVWQTPCREHQKETGITLHSWNGYNEQKTGQPWHRGLKWYPPLWCGLLESSTNRLDTDQKEPGVARAHQVITTLFSTRMGSQKVMLWHAVVGAKSLHRAPKPTPHVEVSVELLPGAAKFAFYVELTFANPKAKWFILLVKKNTKPIKLKIYSTNPLSHGTKAHNRMICKILETASAMRKISHLPQISEIVFFFPPSWWNSQRTHCSSHLHLHSVSKSQ